MDRTTPQSLTPKLTKEQQDIFNETFVALSRQATTLLIRFGDHPTDAPLTELQEIVNRHEEATTQEKNHFEEGLPEYWKRARSIEEQASSHAEADDETVFVAERIHTYLYPFEESPLPFHEMKIGLEKCTKNEAFTENEQRLILNYLAGLRELFEDNQKVIPIFDAFYEQIEKHQMIPTPQT